jgi:lysophospholipase L1-like esterase
MSKLMPSFVAITLLSMLAVEVAAADSPPLAGVRRVVFLGDSITYSGQYIELVETYLRLRNPEFDIELLDLGLPSETVSGLSEPGHASGKFPRPDLHERLQRVLDKTKPDLVVACYGMNCGMYYPFSEERFARYRQGIEFLRERAATAGARVLHLTPPVFDPVPIQARTLPAGLAEYRQPYAGYNEVLDRYSAWLVGQRAHGWDVIDIHSPMNRFLAERRKQDPNFRLANDGVHIDAKGHWLIAQQLLIHWGAPESEIEAAASAEQLLAAYPDGLEVLKLVSQRQRVLKDAWLSTTGHLRPGIKPGLPVDEAQRQAAELTAKIRALTAAARQ